jgi:hypothetical protein
LSILDGLACDSNVSEGNDPDRRKQPSSKNSTDAEIAISSNSVSCTTEVSIRDDFDPDSDVSELNDAAH